VVVQAETALVAARQAAAVPSAALHVGYYGTMWATLVAAALRQFRRQFPKTQVTFSELSPAQIVEQLRKGALDIAVLGHSDVSRRREFVSIKIASVQALIALSAENPLAKRRILSLEELRDEPFLSYAPDYAPGRDATFLKACRAAKFKPKMVCEARGLPALLLAVAENRGIAVVSPFAPRAPHPGVVFARLRPPGVLFELSVVHRRHLAQAGLRLAELIADVSRK
jgi:DNA-binding transcriptional LysR family regulator